MVAAKSKSSPVHLAVKSKSTSKSASPRGASSHAKAKVKAAKSVPAKSAKSLPPKASKAPAKARPSKAPAAKAKVAPPTRSVAPKAASIKPPSKSIAPKAASKSIAPKAASIKPPSKSIAPKAIAPKVTPAGPIPERRSKIPPKFTVRSPADADERKAKIGALATAINQIKLHKRTLSKSFMEIGAILVDIRERKLFEVKGLSFEAFVEREIELGKTMSLRLVRAVELFHKPAALAGGLERVIAAVRAFDGDADPQMTPTPGTSPGFVRSPIPFHKR